MPRPRPQRQRLALLVLATLGTLGVRCGEDRGAAVLAWVQGQDLSGGTTRSLQLPEELRRASVDGQIVAARLADGRLCVLTKTSMGFKENFDGTVRCTDPLRPNEIVEAPARPYLSLAGHGIFEELYIRRRTGDSELMVFFDLN